MDNQEAIKILNNLKPGDYSNPYEKGEAIVMAIEALQAQDKKSKTGNSFLTESADASKERDLISRQEAIEAVEHITSSMSVCVNTDECHGMKRMQRQAVIELANLPSAEPEQKWIPCKTGILPEKRDEFYQATYLLDDGDRMVDYVYFNSKGMWSNYAYEYSELLAWMPLPEAYKGG